MKRWTLLLIVVLLLSSLACSLSGGKSATPAPSQATAAPKSNATSGGGNTTTQENTATPQAQTSQPENGGSSDSESFPTLDPNALAGLDSYRSKITMTVVYTNGTTEQMEMSQEEVRDPLAKHILLHSDQGDIEMIQVGDTQWMRLGDNWMQSPVGDEQAFGDFGSLFIGADELADVSQQNDYKYIGREDVNGVRTKHYQLKYNASMNVGQEEISNGVADIWIANESNLPEFAVRFKLEASGMVDNQQSQFSILQDVYDINKPITIEPPEDAQNVGLPDDIPMYPGATGVTSMGGMVVFSSEDDVATVSAFYIEKLEADGWTKTDGMDTDALVTRSYTKGDRTVQISVTTGDNGGSQVMITTEQ